MTSIVLSYSDGSPHTSMPPTASSASSSRSAVPHTSARRARQSSTAPRVGGGPTVARRVGQLDDPVGRVLDEALADLLAQRHEVPGVAALVDHEEHVHLVERAHGLGRDVLGIARADADDEQPPHRSDPTGDRVVLILGGTAEARELAAAPARARAWR